MESSKEPLEGPISTPSYDPSVSKSSTPSVETISSQLVYPNLTPSSEPSTIFSVDLSGNTSADSSSILSLGTPGTS